MLPETILSLLAVETGCVLLHCKGSRNHHKDVQRKKYTALKRVKHAPRCFHSGLETLCPFPTKDQAFSLSFSPRIQKLIQHNQEKRANLPLGIMYICVIINNMHHGVT